MDKPKLKYRIRKTLPAFRLTGSEWKGKETQSEARERRLRSDQNQKPQY